ncbi:hypothetical protein Q762_15045, partial [Flavobacterium cauense R2A-7]|uniref:T9SS type B sorting domain-containing protein n=1 Tax=Flavobacterium cauense TaxID=510946 RepID=UPI00052BDA1D
TYQAGTSFVGLASGSYNVTVRDTATGCVSAATSVTVNPIPATPTAPISTVVSPSTCAITTGSITITAPTGATLEYSVNGVTYQAGTSFAGLASGTYNVTVRDTATGCVSSAATETINPAPGAPTTPTASVTVQPTCTTPTGTIVITAPTGVTLEYSINGVTYQAGTSFAGLASGTYSVTVRDMVTGCVSSATSVTVNPIPANPATPTASVTVQPTCATPTGTIVITAPTGATLEYSVDGVTYQSGTSFAGLASGTYNVTVRDTTTGCVSSSTSVTVNPIPANPVAPTSTVVSPSTCAITTGSITVTAPIGATLEYSIDGVIYQSGTSFSGLASGTYNVTVRDTATGCISSAATETINPAPGAPAAPTATATVQPTCASPSGTIVITAPIGATLEYSVGGITYQSGTSFAGLTPGVYSVTVRDTVTGCVSSAVSVTVNPIPTAPAVPTASVTLQPTCAVPTGTIDITTPIGATLEYSIDGVVYQTSTSFAGLAPGNYTVSVRDMVTGCVSSNVAILIVDTVPVPVSVSITGGCIDGNYTLTATPMDDTAYSYEWFDSTGASVGSVNPITVTVAGIYTVEVTALDNGCVSQDVLTVASAFCDIPRGISPNGDGKNDAFDITGLNAKSVKIFNRYGVAT